MLLIGIGLICGVLLAIFLAVFELILRFRGGMFWERIEELTKKADKAERTQFIDSVSDEEKINEIFKQKE